MNMCGNGETLLAPYIVELTKCFLEEGHFVTLVTNGTVKERLALLCEFPQEYKNRLLIKFSYHHLELKRLRLQKQYFYNVRMIREAGISFTVELTANDESIPYIDEIKRDCVNNIGACCHIIESRDDTTPAYDRMTRLAPEEHIKAWSNCESPLIMFQAKPWREHRYEFCYAGDWILNVEILTGNVNICLKCGHYIFNAYDNPSAPFHFAAIGENCPWSHCFSAYFLLTNGAIPSYDAPTYASLRDRICNDGSTWLTPLLREFISHKLKENNEEYSEDKKIFINALMAKRYESDSEYNKPIDEGELLQAVRNAAKQKNVKTIAFWSINNDDYLDLWERETLKKAGIEIKYRIVSSGKNGRINRNSRNRTQESQRDSELTMDQLDGLQEVDAVVIGDYAHFDRHAADARKIRGRLLFPITELVD